MIAWLRSWYETLHIRFFDRETYDFLIGDHEDALTGYRHYTISIEDGPGLDEDALLEELSELVDRVAGTNETHISGRRHVCLFSEGDTRHVWDGR